MRVMLFAGLVAVGLSASAAPVPKQATKTNAEKIVGTWDLYSFNADTKQKVGVVEFVKDGKMTVRFGEMKHEGKYKVEKDKIDYELQVSDHTQKEVLTIEKLTDDEMVTVDPMGVKEEFRRVKDKEAKKDN